MADVTRILSDIEQGNAQASDQLLLLVYDEPRELAAARMALEKLGHTVQAAALLHEACLRLVDRENPQQWEDRGHFFAAAAEAMKRLLVERARQKKSLQHGRESQRANLDAVEPVASPLACDDILGLDGALDRLEIEDPRKAQLVKQLFFEGLTKEQAAKALGVPVSTAEKHWRYARCWLRLEMSGNR